MRRAVAAVVLLVLAVPSAAAAQDPDYWDTVLAPDLPAYRRELRAGLQLLYATETSFPDEIDRARREALLRAAATHFSRATRLQPDRLEAHYYEGSARSALGDDDGSAVAFARVRALQASSPFEADMAFKLGVAHTRQLRFEEAVVEYDRAIGAALDERQLDAMSLRSVSLSNKAEVLMGLGRLEESITSYRMAFDADERNVGALWGLACALDRDQQVGPAREVAARAAQADAERHGIVGPDVFFVPDYERHYYLGLAFEAQGETDSARAAWQSFLDAAGPDGRWSAEARRHLEDHARPARRARRRAPAPVRP